MKHNGRSAMTRSKGTKGMGYLQKDKDGHQVPGFLKGESTSTMQARQYTMGAHDRTGPSSDGTKITLPG